MQFCEHCGRPRIDVEWSRRIKRIGLIVFGVAIQGMAGLMIFLVPPGASAWAWIVYLSMGLAGFLHMFIGIELTRRDARDGSERQRNSIAPAEGLSASGHARHAALAEGLPLHARRCPACDHSLIETIEIRRRTCPGCQVRFSLRELGFVADDPAGELHAASPHEARLSGGALVTTLVAATLVAGLVLTTLLAVSGSGTPGP